LEHGVWDLPTRLFHWALALLVVFSFVTGKIGGPWLDWHMQSGYAILALLLFRFAWGMAGSPSARFASFVRGPRAGIAYARALLSGTRVPMRGHNPMGGWMVVALLAILLVQAATGLFSNDESTHQGPLAVTVSNAVVDRMSVIHGLNQWMVAGATALHVAAIAAYRWWLKIDLVRPMVFGSPTPRAPTGLALALLCAAAAAVYALVVVYPR
jgi:cytochrome b